MSSIPSIRLYQPSDLPELQQVRRAAFAPVFQSFREIVGERVYALALADADLEQEKLLDQICRDDPEQVFVAEVEGRIAGFVSFTLNVEKRIGEIGLNAVHPEQAGIGIGTLMYERVMEHMKERGMLVATVGTGGDPSHAPARRAYEKVGFGAAIPSVYLYKVL